MINIDIQQNKKIQKSGVIDIILLRRSLNIKYYFALRVEIKQSKRSPSNINTVSSKDIIQLKMSKEQNNNRPPKENIKEDLRNIKDNVKENVADMKSKVQENINDIKTNAKENLNNVKENIKSEIKKPKIQVRPVPSRFGPGMMGLVGLVAAGSLYYWYTTNQRQVVVAVPAGTTVKTTTIESKK